MKKIILTLIAVFLMLPVFADTMPYYTNSIPKGVIGLYQTGEDVTIYSEPSDNAKIEKKYSFSYNPETMPDGIFGVLLNEKKLGFIYVTDISDDGWVEILYNKLTGEKGWVKTEDRLQFLPWINFYNMYGRKYGLRLMKNVPDSVVILHAKSDELSQNLSKLNYVQKIKLTAIRGNWALVTAFDMDKTPKTGFLKWRNEDGTIYAFPNIK